jgi:hypothetical protein
MTINQSQVYSFRNPYTKTIESYLFDSGFCIHLWHTPWWHIHVFNLQNKIIKYRVTIRPQHFLNATNRANFIFNYCFVWTFFSGSVGKKQPPPLKVKWSLTCDSLNNDCLTTDPILYQILVIMLLHKHFFKFHKIV